MLYTLFFIALISTVSSKCTNKLFLEQASYTKATSKSTSIVVQPALYWKELLINHCYGYEIYNELDFNQYELMTHAYREGMIIHRICEKNSDYSKYGKITQTPIRGFIVNTNNLFKTDLFLYNNNFETYYPGHNRNNFERFKRIQKQLMIKENEKKNQEFKKNYPRQYYFVLFTKYLFYAAAAYSYNKLFM